MDEKTKRQMNRLSNVIIVLCVIALVGIAMFRKPVECRCVQVSASPPSQVVNI